ncbi:MAG TPA: GNAT family N-acetyltransferase [Candidatus Limnocylindria bacterium]|nr:GNAT family N-acetyltransferase [Candidatus Limnocylindria bacterium]
MNTPKRYEILRVDPATMSEDALADAGRLLQAMNLERVPEDPPTPVDVIVQRIRATTPSQWRAIFAARDRSGALVGSAFVGWNRNEPENAHVRWSEVNVLPAHRRRGVGRALFAALVEACLDQGDGLVFMGQTSDRVPAGEHFARAIAASPGLAMRLNQLTIADVDRAKVAEWTKLDPAGYRLERADNTVPKHLIQPYLDAANAMNDMPKGELRFADQRFTEEQLHDREEWLTQAGMEWWLVVAVHATTGEGAGFTEVSYDPRVAHLLQQGGTGVTQKHRGHRLGLWMKAAMLDRIVRERPAARYVRTGNANVNENMLEINTLLGFRHAWSNTLWQLPLAEARTSLGLRERAAAKI